jgi:hypothetical protein
VHDNDHVCPPAHAQRRDLLRAEHGARIAGAAHHGVLGVRGFVLVVCALAALGCQREANVHLRSQHEPRSAVILSSECDGLRVEEDGEVFTIPRDDVEDIDHPGNVMGILGVVLATGGIAIVVPGAATLDMDQRRGMQVIDGRTIGGIMLGVGLGATVAGAALTGLGFAAWSESTSATENLASETPCRTQGRAR